MQFLLAIRVAVNSKVVAIDVQKGLLVLSMIALENFLLVIVFGNGSEKIRSKSPFVCQSHPLTSK